MGTRKSKPVVNFEAIIVNPNGGLGNQLFQIANGYAYSLRYNKKFYICSSWKGINKDRPTYWDSCFKNLKQYLIASDKIGNIRIYKEPKFSYSEIPNFNRHIIFEGYYQSSKYFEDYSEAIRNLFTLPEDLRPKDEILSSKEVINVAIHIRRGDYLANPDFHIPVEKAHYENAKKMIEEKLGFRPNYCYFSDDINWAKENFKESISEKDKFISGYKDYEELYIMSLCDHFIIANSSFSWWAAWLSKTQKEEDKIVICPNPWFGSKGPLNFQDIYCDKWIPLIFDITKSINIKINWKENTDVYYINLENRTDRKEQIESELSKIFSSPKRFNAIKNSNGAIGCGKSHIEILKKGLTSDKDFICVFEDDFVWELQIEDVKEKIDSIFSENFNIVLLSYHYPVISPKKLSAKKLGFFENCQMASSYIIRKRFIPVLLDNFEKCIYSMEVKNKENTAIDQSWKSLQTFENKFFVSSPRLGKQKPSYSDIEKKEVSYGGTCFMGILSCNKYKERRDKQDLKLCPFEYRYFIGNPELTEAIEVKEEKTVYLPCKDDYEYLPSKVHEMLKWINKNYPHIDYIFKTDDDIKFNFINLLKNFKHITVKKFDYTGLLVKCKEHYNDYIKKKDPKFDLIKVPATKYCAGGGYFISKKCVDILILDLLKENTLLEDQSVGYCLNKHNIFPSGIKIRNYSCAW
jgi:GR25 family glycosyltransferase involved in LPS biosynthesis